MESAVVFHDLTPKLKVLWKQRVRDAIFKMCVSVIQLCLNKRLRETRSCWGEWPQALSGVVVASKPWREVLAVALRKPVEVELHLRQENS